MRDQIIIQYVGFEVGTLARNYAFAVRDVAQDPLRYTLAITNAAFVSRLVRYQDAPEICSLRLLRELDTHANHPPTTHFDITDADLAGYRAAHAPKPSSRKTKSQDEKL